MLIYGWEFIIVSHYFAFGGDWSSASGDIKYLICHLASQNHVIEGPSSFMSGSSSWYCHHFAKFDGHRYCTSRCRVFLVCHVIKQDYLIKGSSDHSNRSPLR